MLKVVIAGAAGRMGQALVKCAAGVRDLKIVGAVECAGHAAVGKDAGVVAGMPVLGVPITTDVKSALSDADVLVDFTLHDAVPRNAEIAASLGKAMVIGATGLDAAETGRVKKAAAKIPIVWSPNMSLGVNLLFAMVKKAASVLGDRYRVELDETHHIHKKDAPSGTALRLGEKVAEGMNWDFKNKMVHDPAGAGNIHAPGKIVIRSHREGEVVGDHTVSFENNGEKVEFTHHAWSREAFAMGAFRAARWVRGKKPGIYDMLTVLDL